MALIDRLQDKHREPIVVAKRGPREGFDHRPRILAVSRAQEVEVKKEDNASPAIPNPDDDPGLLPLR